MHCQWCGCCNYIPGKKDFEKNIVGNEKLVQAHLEGSDGRMPGMVSVATQTVSTLSVATQTMEVADEVFGAAETQKGDFQVALLREEAASVGSSIDGAPQRFGLDVTGVQQSPTNEAEQSQGCDAEFAPFAEVSGSGDQQHNGEMTGEEEFGIFSSRKLLKQKLKALSLEDRRHLQKLCDRLGYAPPPPCKPLAAQDKPPGGLAEPRRRGAGGARDQQAGQSSAWSSPSSWRG